MNYLITGVPGAGKTTVGEILKKRGFRVIDIDAEHKLMRWLHKDTRKVGNHKVGMSKEWLRQHVWVWDDAKMDHLLKKDAGSPVFVVGTASDIEKKLSLFDKVFLLRVSMKKVRERLANRPGKDAFGRGEDEVGFVEEWQEEFEIGMIDRGATPIDAEQPAQEVVREILNNIHNN